MRRACWRCSKNTEADVDDQFVDVDFEKCPEYTFGALSPAMFGDTADFEQTFGVMSDAEIDAAMEAMEAAGGGADQLVTRIYNQKSEGSCVANACSQALEIIQALQFGKENVVPLSAISLYKRIGRSPGSGAMVSDGLKEIQARGVLPLDTPANRAKYGSAVMPNTGFYERYPANWEETAAKFKGVEAYTIRSVAAMFTAGCLQHPVVVGRQGHSICYVRPMRRSGRRVFKYANSWGNWGDNGYGYDSESQIRQSASWAFALRSATVPT